jgi:hypothetical protein
MAPGLEFQKLASTAISGLHAAIDVVQSFFQSKFPVWSTAKQLDATEIAVV